MPLVAILKISGGVIVIDVLKKSIVIISMLVMSLFFAFSVHAADSATIRSVQQALTDAGYNCGPIDGIAGPKTAAGIKAYQSDKGFEVSGEISDELVEALGITEADLAGTGAADTDDCYGLLIIGSDRRDRTWNGNADAIILATINKKTETIYFSSFMRDTYANIPGYGVHKINHAYAVGGGELLAQTIRDNFGLKVDNYVGADWAEAAAIIDLFGGVEIEIKDYELGNLKTCINGVCKMVGVNAADYYITSAGLQHLNGVQAVSYCRIRKVGNGDYERTERQRSVLTYLLSNLSLTDAAAVTQRLSGVLANSKNDFSAADIVALAGLYSTVKNYTVETNRVPFEGLMGTQGEMLVPSQPATNEKLKTEIYG